MRKRLGSQKSSGVTFVDLPATAGESYTGLVLLSQLFASFEPPTQWNASEPEEAAPDGVAKLLPPLSVILPHLAPAGGVAWSDDAGYHVRSVTPFPGAQMLGPGASQMSLGQSAMMAGVLLPALGAARRTATQMEAATNLRQIGVGFHVYAQDHDGAFPKNMAELVTAGYVPPNVVVSPESGTVVPPDFEGWSAEQKTRWVSENVSFVVVPGLDKDTGFEKVAAFQKPEETMGGPVAVLFLDGHVESVPPDRARQLIQDQTGKSPEELAEQAGAEKGDDAAPAAPQ
jgi:prepilin-type processing-associated H-X9-DG protein